MTDENYHAFEPTISDRENDKGGYQGLSDAHDKDVTEQQKRVEEALENGTEPKPMVTDDSHEEAYYPADLAYADNASLYRREIKAAGLNGDLLGTFETRLKPIEKGSPDSEVSIRTGNDLDTQSSLETRLGNRREVIKLHEKETNNLISSIEAAQTMDDVDFFVGQALRPIQGFDLSMHQISRIYREAQLRREFLKERFYNSFREAILTASSNEDLDTTLKTINTLYGKEYLTYERYLRLITIYNNRKAEIEEGIQ